MGFFKNKPLIVTAIVIVILIALMAITSSGSTVTESTSVVGGAFVPVQKFFYQISSTVGNFFDGIANSSDTTQQNEQLDEELSAIKGQMNNYAELQAENERLKTMLEYKQANTSQELKVAKVIGKNPGNWFDVFTIDLGKNDGIEKNMPVITADGLVGRVEEVGLNWAKVMAVIDGRSNVAAIMERTRDQGVVKGSISQDSLDSTLYMNYLSLDSDIIEGDRVLTSGNDQLYPKGLVVGTVETTEQTGTSGVSVTIKSAVDFRRLEEVFVLVAMDGEQTGETVQSQQGNTSSALIVPTPGTEAAGTESPSPSPDAQQTTEAQD